jgi:hypothetical protein
VSLKLRETPKFVEEVRKKGLAKDFAPFAYGLYIKKSDLGEDIINTTLNIVEGSEYADVIAFHMPPLTQELKSKTQGQLYQEW